MRDPSTFEARLADAFESYAVAAPVAIDSRALVAELARRPQARSGRWSVPAWPATRAWRLLVVAATLVLAGMALALVAGGLRDPGPPPFASGTRLLVWMPTGADHGTATLLGAGGRILGARELDSRGCPSLVGGTDTIAVRGRESIAVHGLDGRPVDGLPAAGIDTSYGPFEIWSADGRSVALIDSGLDLITVTRLDPAPGEPASVVYGRDGGLDGAAVGSFSADGSRLVVVGTGSDGGLEIHVLEAGVDRLVTTLEPAGDDAIVADIAPDGRRAMLVEHSATGPSVVTLLNLDDGTIEHGAEHGNVGEPVTPLGWSPDSTRYALRVGSGVRTLEVDAGPWHTTGIDVPGFVRDAAWAPAGDRLAILLGDALLVHADGQPDRRIPLPDGAAALSPDGSTAVVLGGPRQGEPYEPGQDATLLAVDAWDGGGEPRLVATLPAASQDASGNASAEPACIDWRVAPAP